MKAYNKTIYFFSNKDYNFNDEDIKHFELNKFSEIFDNLIKNESIISFDIEATSLNHIKAEPLLYCININNESPSLVIDVTNIELTIKHIVNHLNKYADTLTYLGANIKYDMKITYLRHGLKINNVRDVIVQEQRLTQNMGYSYSLDSIFGRYFREELSLNKEIRKDFINTNSANFVFQKKHINYGAEDVIFLKVIDSVQRFKLEKLELLPFIDKVENRLVKVLCNIELEGFSFDKEKWEKVAWENQIEAWKIECELDNILKSLKETLSKDRKIFISGGKYERIRQKPTKLNYEGLFGFDVSYKTITGDSKKPNDIYINYSSPTQIMYLFAVFNFPLITKEGVVDITPIIDKVKNTRGETNIKIINQYEGFTTSGTALEQLLIKSPEHPGKVFIKKLIEYRNITTLCSTFGDEFINKYFDYNTKKVFTTYRQCSENSDLKDLNSFNRSPVNGRLSSGNVNAGYYNQQNIPRDKRFRECFIAEDNYEIITRDLSGAEVTIMADKANDSRLLELSGKDIHSHMATLGWRNILLYRAGLNTTFKYNNKVTPLWNDGGSFMQMYKDPFILSLLESNLKGSQAELFNLSQEFTITKEINSEYRQPAKNLTFGSVYGCKPKKAAETLNISYDEGYIYINTIKKEIPDTFTYVENNVKFALKYGYLEIDNISKTRVWFPEIISIIRANREIVENNKLLPPSAQLSLIKLDYDIIKSVDGQARNIPISGTQANMIKHMMVNIQDYINEKSIDAYLVGQVHDELLVKAKKSLPKYEYCGTMMSFDNVIKYLMEDTANIYLRNFEMSSEGVVLPYWTK